jgi:hypothetical protein
MRTLRSFLAFGYRFVVGDCPALAVGVLVVLALTAVLGAGGVNAWWLPPIAVPALLAVSLVDARPRRDDRG